jgi:NNP family nitrate/nitrite transporter-like MFS transporter
LFGTGLLRAGLFTAFYSLSASLLRVLGGYASDRMGGEKVAFVSFLIVGFGASVMISASKSGGLALAGEMVLALGMGFANAAVFKLVPKYSPAAVGGAAGIVGGLGAFGGFVIPLIMGLFVKINGQPGYAQGFSVFVVMAVLALILFAVLNRYAPVEAAKTVSVS